VRDLASRSVWFCPSARYAEQRRETASVTIVESHPTGPSEDLLNVIPSGSPPSCPETEAMATGPIDLGREFFETLMRVEESIVERAARDVWYPFGLARS